MRPKIICFSLLLAFLLIGVENATGQTQFGVRAGMNLAGLRLVNEIGEKQETGVIPRFQIGITVDIPIAADISIQPAALYSSKGFKQNGGWLSESDREFRATASYIEIPVNLLYSPELGSGNLIFGAGPYAGYATGGKWKADQAQVLIGDIMIEPRGDVIFRNDVADGEFGNYLYGKPWDFGINIILGYELIRRITLQLNGQFGLANLAPQIGGDSPRTSIKNRVYGITMGYKL